MFSHSVLCQLRTSVSNFEFFFFKLQTELMIDSRKRKGKVKVSGLNLLSSKSAFLSANRRKVTKMRSIEKRPSENLLGIKKFIWFYRLFWLTVRIQLRICKFFEIIRPIYSNNKRSKQLIKQNTFLACYWRFFRSNTLEWIKRQLE